MKIKNKLRVVEANNRLQNSCQFPHINLKKWIFWRNKHDDPIFSLHLMIADMLGYILSKYDTIADVDNYFMRAALGKLYC